MVLIVMMNLLISIVSEAYNEMAGTAEITLYQEVCEVIDDAYSMVKSHQNRSPYLCVAQTEQVNEGTILNENTEETAMSEKYLQEL